ncbi:hypothetical protein ASG12_18145 [Williamsia sp. Leaf354]|uniref:hypothetical protein n=1 Tax=Williamsia sp. Leaf354 TaxID=1736349 RepID=UPI000701D9BA|nr:hypothetical protein [Williamsia sp. Leaf354]KQR96137.1 hypothetical protein ASG12_18145 [Williamsia sp. Leaf354]
MSYSELSQNELATLVPELLLAGQLIDRSAMAHVIGDFGRDVMAQVAIEEWMAASPVYTARMRRAMGVDGDGVVDMFKCLQLDIGAPPQFMDFRYSVVDEYHGSFVLDHCGALMDVEPMGEDYVTAMCHDIEDPTFDATAIATNRRARIRPVHRPPRRPENRTPHCEWLVTIEPDREELDLPDYTHAMFATRAADLELSAIDHSEKGWNDYSGDLLDDLQFRDWAHSTLVRTAEEVAVQHQLLIMGFIGAVSRRTSAEHARELVVKAVTGIAGLTAERIRSALGIDSGAAGLARVLSLHPALGPEQYVGLGVIAEGDGAEAIVSVRIPQGSAAVADGSWLVHLDPDNLLPLQAIATAVDPHWVVQGARVDDGFLTVDIGWGAEQRERKEVAVVRFSGGASFRFDDRGAPGSITPLSITPV